MQVTGFRREKVNPNDAVQVLHGLTENDLIVRAEADYSRGAAVKFTLRTQSPDSLHARRVGPNRKRSRCADFEAHRQVIQGLLERFPGLTVRTALGTYRGLEDFKAKWWDLQGRGVD